MSGNPCLRQKPGVNQAHDAGMMTAHLFSRSACLLGFSMCNTLSEVVLFILSSGCKHLFWHQ